MKVVGRLPLEEQTKESVRRDGAAAAWLLCVAICFYCMALGHMFLLYGPKPYAPKPYAPKTYGPKPYAPKPYGPKPYAPKTHAPKTYASNTDGLPYNGTVCWSRDSFLHIKTVLEAC